MGSVSDLYSRLMRIAPLKTRRMSNRSNVVRTGTVNFFVYRKDDRIVCFDSGYGKRKIIRELTRLGVEPRSVTHLFLRYSDFDYSDGVELF